MRYELHGLTHASIRNDDVLSGELGLLVGEISEQWSGSRILF